MLRAIYQGKYCVVRMVRFIVPVKEMLHAYCEHPGRRSSIHVAWGFF